MLTGGPSRAVTQGAGSTRPAAANTSLTKQIRRLLDPFTGSMNGVIFRCLHCPDMEAPVFIIGHWRSGTAHNLLSCDDRFGCCSTYQTVFPT